MSIHLHTSYDCLSYGGLTHAFNRYVQYDKRFLPDIILFLNPKRLYWEGAPIMYTCSDVSLNTSIIFHICPVSSQLLY